MGVGTARSALVSAEGVRNNTHTPTLTALLAPEALFKVWHCLMLSFPLPPELQVTVKISLKTPKQTNLPAVVFGEKTLEAV